MSTRKSTVSRRDVVITLDEDVLLKIKSRAEKQAITVHAWLENAVLDVYGRS